MKKQKICKFIQKSAAPRAVGLWTSSICLPGGLLERQNIRLQSCWIRTCILKRSGGDAQACETEVFIQGSLARLFQLPNLGNSTDTLKFVLTLGNMERLCLVFTSPVNQEARSLLAASTGDGAVRTCRLSPSVLWEQGFLQGLLRFQVRLNKLNSVLAWTSGKIKYQSPIPKMLAASARFPKSIKTKFCTTFLYF